jgi:hypothetical protein
MQGFMTCSNKVKKETLDLILHAPGGDLEATKRIITYLRKIYKEINPSLPKYQQEKIFKKILLKKSGIFHEKQVKSLKNSA